MEDTDLAYFHKLLLDQKEALLNRGFQTLSELRENEHNCTDPLDMAALHTRQTCALQIQDREHRLIKETGLALLRIQEKEYGYCELCGEEISLARLKVRPTASHCMECKAELENQEKIKFYNDAVLMR